MKNLAILIADDETETMILVRDLVTEILGATHQIEFFLADSVENAQSVAQGKPISLVISDYRMNGKYGTELVSWAKEQFPGVATILMSGDLKKPESNADGFLPKPIDYDALVQLLSQLLAVQT
jgi:DNA-binding NtrC family response regulator